MSQSHSPSGRSGSSAALDALIGAEDDDADFGDLTGDYHLGDAKKASLLADVRDLLGAVEESSVARDLKKRAKRLSALVDEQQIKVKKAKEVVVRKVEAVKQGPTIVRNRVRSELRKRVTGDPNKRLRDHMKEPRQTRLVDRVSFTMGVVGLCATEFVLLTRPDKFWLFFVCWLPVLIVARWWWYRRQGYHYFLLDFCYFVQAICVVSIIFPQAKWLFQVVFVFSNGPLAWAIFAWRNSLVFHSLDKITSVFIHAFPPMLTFAVRWYPDTSGAPYCEQEPCTMTLLGSAVFPLLGYAMWQASYFLKTEYIDRAVLSSNPQLQTSLRWLARDKRNPLNVLSRNVVVKLGLMAKTEDFDSETWKTKLVFASAQFAYTLITMLPTSLLYQNFYLHLGFLLFVFANCVWNGATFYIEVFSSRYSAAKRVDRPSYDEDAVANEELQTATPSEAPTPAPSSPPPAAAGKAS